MRHGSSIIRPLACLALLAFSFDSVRAAEQPVAAKPFDVGKLVSLEVHAGGAAALKLRGSEGRQQLVVSAIGESGNAIDVTRAVTFDVQPAGVVHVSTRGVVTTRGDGQATISIQHAAGLSASVPVTVESFGHDAPVNFPNQIVPIFTKLSCNGGGCHGKSGGQNGFRLSLLGFEPAEDYEYLIKEARGRRISITAPSRSLLILKGAGVVPHGGGQRLEPGSPAYKLMHRWIAEGAPYGDPEAAKVAHIEVFPQSRLMGPGTEQQLVVMAHYTDGTSQDVTDMAKYEPNVAEMAEIDVKGLTKTMDLTGDVAVMVRYQGHVDVFRATVPLGVQVDQLPIANNFVDEHVFKKLQLLGLPPSEVSDDTTFLRRVTIDIAGRLPSVEETEAFIASTESTKREQWIDYLLESPDYSYYFANKWASILRNKRRSDDYKRGTFAFHRWIRSALEQNVPYDEFARSVLTASGDVGTNPPTVWYREVKETNEQVEDAAQLFLGLRIQCARCHHHPFEKWSQNDYYSFSAFFSQVGRKKGKISNEQLIYHKPGEATAKHPKSGEALKPAGLGGETLEIAASDDPREALADWMADPNNPFFARTLVNRYWKHFFGRGLVDPEDDMRATNPATNPELLDALAKNFIESRFDLKQLVRTITRSTTYQLSSNPNEYNANDKQNFSRYYPQRLNAEVLLDAVDTVTGSTTRFGGVPQGTRAVELPDSGFNSYFLSVFGRPESASACECERANDANLAQGLHLINSSEIHGKISSGSSLAAQLLGQQDLDDVQRIRQLYLTALSREATADEIATVVAYLEKKGADKKKEAFEDLVWTLINTKEFLFNH